MTSHHIAFRVDASSQIGTGHFMRCLTLADGLNQCGAHIRFIGRELPMHFRDMLKAKGMEFKLLCSDASPGDELAHAHWLGTSQARDAQAAIRTLSDLAWDWLVVDHYALDARWESDLRASARQIMVIDDLADRKHDCDILLDQNFYADSEDRYSGKAPKHCQLLLGPRYALLRDEFRQKHKQIKTRNGPVKRVFVFFGGVDADNCTGRAIEALTGMGIAHVDVVIGAQHPSREQIQALCSRHGYMCHVQTDRMAELMAAADLAIGAGGSAVWERCCLGLPALGVCMAANQFEQLRDAARRGLLYAPMIGANLTDTIKHHTTALLENDNLRQLISRLAMQAVDGHGVLRIISNLGCSGITIRRANAEDLIRLFEWRNHPSIRYVSRNTDPITWESHQNWFADVLASPDRTLLIGQIGETPIGVVRFDRQQDCAEVSIYLAPDGNGSGQGRKLLLSAEQWLKANQPEIRQIRASVLCDNEPSHRLFSGAGYRVEVTHYLKNMCENEQRI